MGSVLTEIWEALGTRVGGTKLIITETIGTHKVVLDMHNRTSCPYLAAINRILISLLDSRIAGDSVTLHPGSRKVEWLPHDPIGQSGLKNKLFQSFAEIAKTGPSGSRDPGDDDFFGGHEFPPSPSRNGKPPCPKEFEHHEFPPSPSRNGKPPCPKEFEHHEFPPSPSRNGKPPCPKGFEHHESPPSPNGHQDLLQE
jgi:hypothetical protein